MLKVYKHLRDVSKEIQKDISSKTGDIPILPNLAIQDIFDMKCPSWLLRITCSYLSDRTLIVEFQGVTSSPKSLPAGAPQGTLLGVVIFIVKVNGLVLRPKLPRMLMSTRELVSVKFMDDASAACSVDLQKSLIKAQ